MKKIVALALLVSMICTPMCAINAHGAEDPCGKGCPLIERYDFDTQERGFIIVAYLYSCGSRGETYVGNVLQSYSIYNYSEDFIRQYFRQSDGSFKYSPVPVPERQMIVAPTTEK